MSTLWRIRATVDDRPGFLSVLTASLALKEINILSVQVHATEAGAVDEFLVDAPDKLTAADLIEAVRRGRGRDPWVGRSDARGLADEPTRVLALAARVIADPECLDEVLRELLGDCEITWRAEPCAQEGFTPSAMQLSAPQQPTGAALPDPSGGTVFVRRNAPAITPAEYARAHAIVSFARYGARSTEGRLS